MAIPFSTWDTKPVFITYRNVLTGSLEPGAWVARNNQRVVNTLANGTREVFRSGVVGQGTLNTVEGAPSLQFNAPVLNDPDITPTGGEIVLTVTFTNGDSEAVHIVPSSSWSDFGNDLAAPDPGASSAAVVGFAVVGSALAA